MTPRTTPYHSALDFAAEQCRRLVAAHPDHVPMYSVGGRWGREGERWTHWCEGFYPGIYWLLHQYTGEASWRQALKVAEESVPPDKRTGEIRKKIDALQKLGPRPKTSSRPSP